MHSTQFTKVAQHADEQSDVVIAMVEDILASSQSKSTFAAAILHNEDNRSFAFTRVEIGPRGKVTFVGEQRTSSLSKALKYLSDWTLDRRPLVYMEDGSQVERGDEGLVPTAA